MVMFKQRCMDNAHFFALFFRAGQWIMPDPLKPHDCGHGPQVFDHRTIHKNVKDGVNEVVSN